MNINAGRLYIEIERNYRGVQSIMIITDLYRTHQGVQ